MQPDVEMVKSMNQYDSGKNNDGNNMICDCDIVKMKKRINILENIITNYVIMHKNNQIKYLLGN